MLDDERPANPKSPSWLWRFWWLPFLVVLLLGSILAASMTGRTEIPLIVAGVAAVSYRFLDPLVSRLRERR